MTDGPARSYDQPMSVHRGVVAAAAVLLVASLSACGFADDNYTNAEKALQNSRPDLTVPASVTTMAPFQTLPGDETGGTLPVELATPEQRAAAIAEAQQRAEERRTGVVPAQGGAPGTRRPTPAAPTTTTTSTIPDTPQCRAALAVQTSGSLLVLSKNAGVAEVRTAVAQVANSFRSLAQLVPPEQRTVGLAVAAAFLPVEQRAATATSSRAIRTDVQQFLAAQSKNVTVVLKAASVICPQVITENTDQAEKINVGD